MGLEYVDLYLVHWPGVSGLKSEDPMNAQLRHESYRELQRGLVEGTNGMCASVLMNAGKVGGILQLTHSICCPS